jgi:hypothetical protein
MKEGLLFQCVNKELMTPGEHESGSIANQHLAMVEIDIAGRTPLCG